MHQVSINLRPIIAYLVGGFEALLLVRLLLRLLAARPDNLFVQALLAGTAPFIAPLAFLDSLQPRFGSALEFSTLALILLVLLIGLVITIMLGRRNREEATSQGRL